MEQRNRYWATIIYQESVPDDWKERLKNLHTPALASPIHDKDIDNKGEVKKSHRHIILLYESLKSRKQATEAFSVIGGVGAESVACLRSYVRYLTHIDNPEKAQYNSDDVIAFSGADYNLLSELSTDKYKIMAEILDYITDNHIESYAEVLNYARHNNPSWFRVLVDNGTMPIVQFLKSKTWERNQTRQLLQEQDTHIK